MTTTPQPPTEKPPANRRLTSAADLDTLRFDDQGLLPVVAQDAGTGQVLMVAWANRESLQTTLETNEMHYWSRSRGELWRKGATSGNVQRLVTLHADCDADTLLALVAPDGPACHTGDVSCFGLDAEPALPILTRLWATLEARARERPEGSYTTRLLGDENLRLKKLGEETAELLTALIRGEERAPEEAADLVYHLMVALLAAGSSWEEVEEELRERAGG